jgi:hypothetical protein
VAGEAVIGDWMKHARGCIRRFQVHDGGEGSGTASDQQCGAGIAHKDRRVRTGGKPEAAQALIENERAAVDTIDARGGHKRRAWPLRRRAGIAARQSERAADQRAETGMKQSTPVNLEINRHRDC